MSDHSGPITQALENATPETREALVQWLPWQAHGTEVGANVGGDTGWFMVAQARTSDLAEEIANAHNTVLRDVDVARFAPADSGSARERVL